MRQKWIERIIAIETENEPKWSGNEENKSIGSRIESREAECLGSVPSLISAVTLRPERV